MWFSSLVSEFIKKTLFSLKWRFRKPHTGVKLTVKRFQRFNVFRVLFTSFYSFFICVRTLFILWLFISGHKIVLVLNPKIGFSPFSEVLINRFTFKRLCLLSNDPFFSSSFKSVFSLSWAKNVSHPFAKHGLKLYWLHFRASYITFKTAFLYLFLILGACSHPETMFLFYLVDKTTCQDGFLPLGFCLQRKKGRKNGFLWRLLKKCTDGIEKCTRVWLFLSIRVLFAVR